MGNADMNVGILGGGISGITLQRYLRHSNEVLEAAGRPGGLCSTIFKDGFGYDIGGHILFSKSQQINQLVEELLGDNCGYAKRANKIYFKNRFVKYPFENGMGVLDKEDIYECLIGYLKRGEYSEPTNLWEWCYHRFGKGLAEMYLIPYYEKIWNIATDQMSLEWVERIPSPPLEDIVRSALGHVTEGYLHQLYFKYPKKGGVEALVDATRKPDGAICYHSLGNPDRPSMMTHRPGTSAPWARRDHTDRMTSVRPIADEQWFHLEDVSLVAA